MLFEPRRWGLVGRRGLLIGLLVAATVVLIVKRDDLALAYRLNSAEHALRGGDLAGATAILERSKERGQTSPRWHYLWACLQRRTGQFALAERHLVKAAALGWNIADIDRQRLLIRAQSGQIKQVESPLAALLQAEVSDAAGEEIYEAMARGYLSALLIGDASKCLKFWIQWQPANPQPHLWMAELHTRMEDLAAAEAELQQVLAIDPEHAEARVKLGKIWLDQHNVSKAIPLFEACREQAPDDPRPVLGLAECHRRQGLNDSARELFYEALVLDLTPEQAAAALSSLGRIALEEGDHARAIVSLRQAIARDQADSTSRLALASALAAVGDSAQAEAERAEARRVAGQTSKLVELVRQVHADPKSADLRTQAGLVLFDLGQWSAGADWLRAALQIDPQHPEAHRGLARYYGQLGDQPRAQEHESAASKHSTDRASAKAKSGM